MSVVFNFQQSKPARVLDKAVWSKERMQWLLLLLFVGGVMCAGALYVGNMGVVVAGLIVMGLGVGQGISRRFRILFHGGFAIDVLIAEWAKISDQCNERFNRSICSSYSKAILWGRLWPGRIFIAAIPLNESEKAVQEHQHDYVILFIDKMRKKKKKETHWILLRHIITSDKSEIIEYLCTLNHMIEKTLSKHATKKNFWLAPDPRDYEPIKSMLPDSEKVSG